jgi:hypothetical protein
MNTATFFATAQYEADILRLEDEIARQDELISTLTKKRNDARWNAEFAHDTATDAHGDYLSTQNSIWFFQIYLRRLNEAHAADLELIKAEADLAAAKALLAHQERLHKTLTRRLSHN